MDEFIQWMNSNKDWLFSGAGLSLVTFLGRKFFKERQSSSSQNIQSGNNSINIQAGHDLHIKSLSNRNRNNVEEK